MVNIDSAADNNREWPDRSCALCFHCAHCFDSVPIYVPRVSHHGTVSLVGNFCSFNCGKSWLLARPKDRQTNLLTFLLMARKLFQVSRIDPAPPKEILQAFGGPVSISTYRKNFLIVRSWNELHRLTFKKLRLIEISPVLPPTIAILDYQNLPPPCTKKRLKPKNILETLSFREQTQRRTPPAHSHTLSHG